MTALVKVNEPRFDLLPVRFWLRARATAGKLLLRSSLFLGIATAPLYGQAAPAAIAFTHVNVVPMDHDGILRDRTVIVRDGRIAAITGPGNVPIPADAVRIEGGGDYLMPGLADMHVHLYYKQALTLFLSSGVTTVFNLNGAPANLLWRSQVVEGEFDGPTIFTVGPKFNRRRTPQEAVAEVEAQYRAGYDGVKIYNQVSAAEYPSLVRAAKQHHMIVIGHVAREPGFAATLAAGQSIAHAEEYLYTYFWPASTSAKRVDHIDDLVFSVPNEGLIPRAASMTKRANIAVVATLVTYQAGVEQARHGAQFFGTSRHNLIPPWDLRIFRDNNVEQRHDSAAIAAERDVWLPLQFKLVRALHDSGVTILAGTDAGGDVGLVPGEPIYQELRNFVAAGMTPYEALRTATVGAAGFLGKASEFGTVQVGKRADLLLVRGNPLTNIENADNRRGVMARGRWYSSDKIARMLDSLPSKYREEIEQLRSLLVNPTAADEWLKANDLSGRMATVFVADLLTMHGIDSVRTLVSFTRNVLPDAILAREHTLEDAAGLLDAESRHVEAIALLKLTSDLYPNATTAQDYLGQIYDEIGAKNAALVSYQRVLAIDSNYPGAKRVKLNISRLETGR